MVKRFLKGILCAVLSLSMALGGVMVGAEQGVKAKIENNQTKVQTGSDIVASLKRAEKRIKIKSAQYPQPVTTTVADTFSRYNNFCNNSILHKKKLRTSSNNYLRIGTVRVSKAGTVIVKYYCNITRAYGNKSKELLKLINTNGTSISGAIMNRTGSGYGHQLWVTNVPAGTYELVTLNSLPEKTYVDVGFLAAVVPNTNGRYLNSSGIVVGGNSGTSCQYFKIKNRGVAKLFIQRETYYDRLYGTEYTVQRKNGRSWTMVQSREYSSSNSWEYVGLSAGTYRLVLKSPMGNVLKLQYKASTANSSYGTKKKNAKTIKRKKYKKQTFLSTDSAKKAHWYKIKVPKKRFTYVDITSLGHRGTIWVQGSGKTGMKSKKIKNGIRFYGTVKAGTYYFKVHRLSKNTTGSYQIKYKK